MEHSPQGDKDTPEQPELLFYEEQRFDQPWLYILLSLIFAITIWAGIEYFNSTSRSVGNSLLLLVPVGLSVITTIFIFKIKLITKITAKKIHHSFYPIITKEHFLEDIELMRLIDYGFVGGWGIRLWTSYGTVYNVRGSQGLHITLKSGKQYVIGTQKPEELSHVLKQIAPATNE